jgi:8-oxo-dGTP pyrophosphatase MutT (NUDIX family)
MSLAETLRAALEAGHRESPELIGSDVLEEEIEALAPAAVLVAVVDRPEPTVILTLRPETMRKHPGQVSFPGGRIDPGDDGPIAAALREAEEEIGLHCRHLPHGHRL